MAFAATPDGIAAEQARQAELNKTLPGHQREMPGNNPPPRRMGELAHGHPVSSEPPGGDPFDPGRIDTHMWCQPPLQPRDFPVITPIYPHDGQALGSSISENAAIHRVRVQQLDAQSAAGPAPGNPSNSPAAAATTDQQFTTAPSGIGQQFRQNGNRKPGNPYAPVPGSQA
jgi:hypothetical protein